MAYILVVEDDSQISNFIVDGFKQAGHSVEHADNAEDANSFIKSVSFDVAIVDIMLKGVRDGLSLVKEWKSHNTSLSIIFLSSQNSVENRLTGFEVGADDYLCKPFFFSELKARVDSLLRRASGAPLRNIFTYANLSLDVIKRKIYRENKVIELQRREFMLLQLFMEKPEQVLGKTMILERVWGYEFDPQTNVVDVLISRLRSKIDKGFSTSLIHTVRGVGYVLKEEK